MSRLIDEGESWVDSEKSGAPQVWAVLVLTVLLLVIASVEAGACGGSGEPSHYILVGMGALSRDLVASGELYRLITAEFLHASFSHVFFNCLALLLTYSLEKVLGAARFLAIFFASAIGASVFSVLFNPHDQISVGASGAVLGMFGAQLVVAYMRMPAGEDRSRLAKDSWQVLIPTLISFRSHGHPVDFAAHVGGAISGAVAMAILNFFWLPQGIRPPNASWAWKGVSAACVILLFGLGTGLRTTLAGCG